MNRMHHSRRWNRIVGERLRSTRLVGVLVLLVIVRLMYANTARAEFAITGSGAEQWRSIVAPLADFAARSLPLVVGSAVPDSARIVICTSFDEFRRHAGGMELHGVLGLAQPGDAVVALNMSLLGPGLERSLAGTLRHELVHLALGAASQNGSVRLPRWFDEGVASWFGGRFTDIGPIAVASLTRAPALRLDHLDASFPEELELRRLAYVKSLIAIERLEAERPGAVAQIVRRITGGVGFDEALVTVSGLTVDDLETSTREHTRSRWLRLYLVRAVGSPYGLLALLVLIGFVIRRWRFRRGRDEWEPPSP